MAGGNKMADAQERLAGLVATHGFRGLKINTDFSLPRNGAPQKIYSTL